MQPFRLEENTRFLQSFPNQLSGEPDFILNQSITNIFAVLEDISRSLAVIADLMINEANKEQTEKLKQAMDSINRGREAEE